VNRLPKLPPREQRLVDSLWSVYHSHADGHDCRPALINELGPDGQPRVSVVGPDCFVETRLLRFIADLEYDLKVRR